MNSFKSTPFVILMCFFFLITLCIFPSCDLSNNDDEAEEEMPVEEDEPMAYLLPNSVFLVEGQTNQLYWYYVEEPINMEFFKNPELDINIFGVNQRVPDNQEVIKNPLSPEILQFHFQQPQGLYFFEVTRNPDQTEFIAQAEVAIAYADENQVINRIENGIEIPLLSPLKVPFQDQDITEPPASSDYSSIEELTEDEYGYSPVQGIGSLSYSFLKGLVYTFFAEVPLGPSAPGKGPIPPAGAEHNKNACGVSVFIRSMEENFPGALPPNAATNANEWDEVAEKLNHSCLLGTHGYKMRENINIWFQHAKWAKDGMQYCAYKLKDESIENLAAWAEDCDLKAELFDLGLNNAKQLWHWVDIDKVDITNREITIQDYSKSYKAKYNEDNELDFTGIPIDGITMEYLEGDLILGNNTLEYVDFYVVCKCATQQIVTDSYQIIKKVVRPSTNSKGETLNP